MEAIKINNLCCVCGQKADQRKQTYGLPSGNSYCNACVEAKAEPYWIVLFSLISTGLDNLKSKEDPLMDVLEGTLKRLGKTQKDLEEDMKGFVGSVQSVKSASKRLVEEKDPQFFPTD